MESKYSPINLPFTDPHYTELSEWIIMMVKRGTAEQDIISEYRRTFTCQKPIEYDIVFIKFIIYYLKQTSGLIIRDVIPSLETDEMILSQMDNKVKEEMIIKFYKKRLGIDLESYREKDSCDEDFSTLLKKYVDERIEEHDRWVAEEKNKHNEECGEEDEENEENNENDENKSVDEVDFDDDFEKLLDEFIEGEIKEYQDKMESDEAQKSEYERSDELQDIDDAPPVKKFEVDFVKIGTSVLEDTCPYKCYYRDTLILSKREKFIHLYIHYSASNEVTSYAVTLNRTDASLYTTQIFPFYEFESYSRYKVVTFDGSLLYPFFNQSNDNLALTIVSTSTGKALFQKNINVYCCDSIYDIFNVNRMILMKDEGDGFNDSLDFTKSLVKFSDDVKQIKVICDLSKNTEIDFDLVTFRYLLYDPEGNIVSDHEASNLDGQHIIGEFGVPMGDKWRWGYYNIELRAYNHLLASTSFEISDVCLEGEVDISTMVRKIRYESQEWNDGSNPSGGMEELYKLVGLTGIKEKITNFGNLIKLNKYREQYGFKATKPSLHARFIGKPGTGKTTVAGIIGKIYKELGLLSKGHVVYAKRSTLVGRYYDSELRAIEEAVSKAQGGVLFIDEAYTLYVEDDPRDPGKKVLEAIMTQLANPNMRDWMLVLAGYGPEMEKLINSNDGLESRVNDVFYFDDYTVDELMQIADFYCDKHNYKMTSEARDHLSSVILREYNSKDNKFANARYVQNLFEKVILVNMAKRINGLELPTKELLQTIEASDMPSMRKISHESKGMIGLDKMVGLDSLKNSIYSHLNMVKLANLRMSAGIHTNMPPLHMIFTGNPGTGKTTVADFIGEIYASMGILSRGEVIKVEKKDLVGKFIGETEDKMKHILARAKGNILFIDEAYQLYNSEQKGDYGSNVMETLLTTLANDRIDMIVIMAGYADKMEELLKMNVGISSRFPYTFHFEDYSVDELHKIALQKATDEGYKFTPKAKEYLHALIKQEVLKKRSNFGNARFVTRLITTQIVPKMADRLLSEGKIPSEKDLATITKADIPITAEEVAKVAKGGFDDEAITIALAKLDSLTGLHKAKKAIRDFVDIAKLLNSRGEKFVGKGVLKWNFVGNTGTGKSTVAAILADILKAMNLLEKGNIVEVKAEEIYNVSEYQCDQVLKQAMAKTGYGMLFIDGDAPELRQANGYHLTNEQLRMKLTSLKAETGNMGALVIAECSSPRQAIANSLAENGIYDYDHIIFFDDYSTDELFEILGKQLTKHKVQFSSEAEGIIRKYIASLAANRGLALANARTMKLLSRTIYKQVLLRKCEKPETSDRVVLEEDVKNYVWNRTGRKIGY